MKLAALTILASGVVLMAQESKLAPDLAGVGPEDTVDVII